jgi:hypothetical protein
MKNKTIILAVILASFYGRAYSYDDKYFQIDESSIKIEEIKDVSGIVKGGIPLNPIGGIPSPNELPKPPKPGDNNTGPVINPPIDNGTNPLDNINNTIDTIDKVVNLMQKIWDIIEKNQPVVNINVNYANAVPYGTSHWTQLQGWSKPATKQYSFSMKNLYGAEVVKVKYQVHYTYNGNYQGKGKFLTGVTVEPLDVETLWDYKVSLTAEVPDSTIANVGTHDDPIASMQVQLKWVVHTPIKDIQSKAIYYVQGDGLIQEIGTPFNNAREEKTEKTLKSVEDKINSVKF